MSDKLLSLFMSWPVRVPFKVSKIVRIKQNFLSTMISCSFFFPQLKKLWGQSSPKRPMGKCCFSDISRMPRTHLRLFQSSFWGLHYTFPVHRNSGWCNIFVLKGCSNLATLVTVHASAKHLKRNVLFERHERRQKVGHLEYYLFNVFSN